MKQNQHDNNHKYNCYNYYYDKTNIDSTFLNMTELIDLISKRWPPVRTSHRFIYYLSCILIALLTTLAIVLNGADCLSSIYGNSSSLSSDRVFVVKSTANNQIGKQNSRANFNEIFDQVTIHVKENTPIGSKLTDIQATDRESNQNAKIIYAIVGGEDQQSFTLRIDNNVNKVELVNEVNLDYESQKKHYNVIIRATSLFLRYEVTVDIIVTDENDNKPQLDDFAIVFNNYKNHFPNMPIGQVPATDADVNDQLRYRVLAGNNAQLVLVNETTGEIQISPWLNSNVPKKAVIVLAVSDGLNEAVAHLVLTVNLVTETMLQNSVVLRLDGIGRDEFLTRKYDMFLNNMARILGTNNQYGPNNIVVFDVEESLQEIPPHETLIYRPYHGSSIINSTISVNISFSARADSKDVESYLSSHYIEERIYLNRAHLMQTLEVNVAPFQDNLCVHEPCQNYQECQALYKFEKAPKVFVTTRNMIFRSIKAVQSFACTCPPTFTGMKHKTECNLQINQCFSNPCLNGGICHRHESGYSCECKPEFIGSRCEHSFVNSTCQSIALTNNLSPISSIDDSPLKQSTMCSGKSRCVNINKSHFHMGKAPTQVTSSSGGFSCQGCPYPQWSTELCQLKARSFNKSSYITLPSLRRRHRFHIMLQFATVQSDALILYNGRYNDKHDFIALEIVDSYLKFSYSLGSSVTTVTLASVLVSDGNWHKVAIDYKDRNVTLLVDDCDPVIDEALARIQGPSSKRCSNTSYAPESSSAGLIDYRMLDLTSPMQIGALPSLPTEFQVSSVNTFVGCMSDIYIDHQLVDLYSTIQEVGTNVGCPEKQKFCHQHQSCNGHPCQDAWGAAKCSCGDEHLGKSCEISISNEKVRKFIGNSYLTFSPIESTVGNNWYISLHFRTINPNGLLFKIALDPESTILLELLNGGLKLSYHSRNMTFNKLSLDDGEWHFVEVIWNMDYTQLQVDYIPNLSVRSSEMGSIVGSVMKLITIGASPTRASNSDSAPAPMDATDFSSSIASLPSEDPFSNVYSFASNNSQSFVGCIYGVNVTDNIDLWINGADERNVERGCQVADLCEPNPCPLNSRCVKKGMNQRKCVCNPGFIGDRCLPICSLNPCKGENSKCHPTQSQLEPFGSGSKLDDAIITTPAAAAAPSASTGASVGYRCECEPYRGGMNCEHQLSAGCPSNWWGKPVGEGNSSICGQCNCDESKGFDGDCDKTTGQCFCKANHYQPVGSEYCLPCDCYSSGSLSTICNQTSGQCKCRAGVVGRRCDTCAGPFAEVTLRGCEVIYDACPKTFSDGIWWDKTTSGKRATQQCPPSISTGTATRDCHTSEGWLKANMFDCISNSFQDLYNKYQFFEDNKFPLTANLAIKVASNLRDALNETLTNPSTTLFGSDMYISFRLIHHLMQHESRQTGLNLTHTQDRMYIRNVVESISYILDPDYADNWVEIAKRSPNGGAEYLLKLLDNYGKVLIESQSDTNTEPFEVSAKYLTFGMDTLSTGHLWDLNKASTSLNNAPTSSPPYATDSYGQNLDQSNTIAGAAFADQSSTIFNADGTSIYQLDYSLSSRDASPAIIIPKHDNYNSDSVNSMRADDTTRALIPLKTLRIKTPQEILPAAYYQAKSRAKREELIIPDLKFARQQPALVVYSIYRSLGPLLPNYSDSTVQHRLGMVASANAPVVWLTVRPTNSSEFLNKNIQPKITYMLKMVEPTGKTRPQCAIWDFMSSSQSSSSGGNGGDRNRNQSSLSASSLNYGIKQTGKFTTKGCEIKGIHPSHRLRYKYDYVNCSCDHLGAVTVLMDSANYDFLAGEESNTKDTALLWSLTISLIIMTAAYFILSCVRGHSIKSNSNSINKNLFLILIALELLIIYSVTSRSSLNQLEYQCKLVAIFLHYFSISLFFWLLVNAIHFYRMLTELRDINHGPMKFYHVLGYAVPAFFVSIAVGLRIEQFGNYLFCWLSIHEPIIWSMFGPISVVSVLTIILFLLALCKSFPVKEDPNGAELLKNHMLINTIKTPLIGFYWLTTVYVVNEALQADLILLFPFFIVLKSVALFVLLCIVDKHIRYNLYVSWLRFKGEKVPFMEETGNYSSSQWLPPMMVGDESALSKHYHPYGGAGYPIGHATTPGFQSSCTDIFRPDVLAFSAASTTSRSTATGTSSSAAYQYNQHHYQQQHRSGTTRDVGGGGGYGRAERSNRHRRRHKKSHHKHHHHRHHHHHHHRSHRHHAQDYDHYESRRLYGVQAAAAAAAAAATNNELASSHSSDADDVSTLPKKIHYNNSGASVNQGASTSESRSNSAARSAAAVDINPDENNDAPQLSRLQVSALHDELQTVPMELPSTSSGLQQAVAPTALDSSILSTNYADKSTVDHNTPQPNA